MRVYAREVPGSQLGGDDRIPFNRPPLTGTEQTYVAEAIARGQISAGGLFTERCCNWLQVSTQCRRALLVHSATAALEMAALLPESGRATRSMMPSFTFVSTANAFVLRGAARLRRYPPPTR